MKTGRYGGQEAMKMQRRFEIRAVWDPEAAVWVASSDDVPGLATEADTVELLIEKLRIMVPELLEANGIFTNGLPEVPFHLLAEREELLHAG